MNARTTLMVLFVSVSVAPLWASEPNPETYAPYTRKGFEKTFKKWGDAGMERVNEYRKKATFAVANSSSCDKVEYADLSDNRSQPPNKIVVFVDCANGQRFYLDNTELDKQASATSIADRTRGLNDKDLISSCETAIRQSLRFPSSFDKAWFTTNVYRAPQGNVVVTFDFTAKNGFGIDLPQQARCVTDDRGTHPPEIYNR